jgi:hypothetical protein
MELSNATEKTPATSGIDPGTFRLVAQCLNHYAPVRFFLSISLYFQCTLSTDHSSPFNDPGYRAENQFISVLVEMLNLKLLLLLLLLMII